MNLLENGRGIGITDALHGAAEWPAIVIFALITQLGDGWLLFLLGGSLYVAGDQLPRWGIDRRRGLFVLALALTYVALIGALKAFFQLPRPPGAGDPPEIAWLPVALAGLFENFAIAEGPGFPSGHALGSTMVWGGLALVLRRGTYWKRIVIAGVIILLVSASRLILGVHYVLDVVVGMGLGVLVLGVLHWMADGGTNPGRVLLAAVGVSIGGLLVGITFESVAAAGGAVGGWLVWRGIADTTPAHPTTGSEVIAGFLVLGVMAVLFGVLNALTPPLWLTFLGTAVAAGGAVGAPLAGERLG